MAPAYVSTNFLCPQLYNDEIFVTILMRFIRELDKKYETNFLRQRLPSEEDFQNEPDDLNLNRVSKEASEITDSLY